MSLFFRYVWRDEITGEYSLHEDFVQFLKCLTVTGEGLFNILIEYFIRKEVPMENCREQRYDGGANMAGCHNGLQAHVSAAYPKAPFVWCAGHCLSLCIEKAYEQTSKVIDHVQEISIAYEY